ncbi:autoinducer binding domain-containing protein [Microbulbifer sp. SAOS-129_SWC]|uniref:autoinducer binding domain-containing protein n=1 Tax=Microbulbifer sp. SAOS-129_SWC TaxID=3145235 RepID=UPI003217B649
MPDLLAAQTIEQVKERIKQSVNAIGFDFFLIGMEGTAASGEARYRVQTNYPRSCVERYNRQGWLSLDPVVGHCRQSPVPLIWHRAHFPGRASQLYEESVAHGIATGVATALRGAAHNRAMMITVANGAGFDERLGSWLTETMPTIQLMASYAYEAICRIEDAAISTEIGLTRRESECLHWAAAGKTSWEISRILSCAEATVNFHFRNVIHKLGVSNRRQAVARALSLGLIRP